VEKIYRDRPKSQRLFAVSWRVGLTPFYYEEVEDCVGHQMKLKTLENAGWIHSKREKGEECKCYQIRWEACRRLKIVFAPDIAELEKRGEEMTGYEVNRVLMPVPPDPRVTQLIDTIWQNVGEDSSERVRI